MRSLIVNLLVQDCLCKDDIYIYIYISKVTGTNPKIEPHFKHLFDTVFLLLYLNRNLKLVVE